jgi:hypothetical protein
MPNQSASDHPLPCGVCGLLLQDERHESAGDCIRGLRKAMIAQRKAAESLSFEVSTRYLAALEELSLRPDVGIPYHMRVPGHPESVVQLHHQQIAGVFTAIVKKYRELGDWSPLKERDKQIVDQRMLIDLCLDLLSAIFTEHYAVTCDRGELEQLKQIGELARQLGVPLPDPEDSGLLRR